MRYIIFFLVAISLHAQILTSKQLFNIKTTKPTQETIAITNEYYGTTTIDETKISDVVLRFDGYTKELQADFLYKKIEKNQKLFAIYSSDVVSTCQELLLAIKYNKSSSYINSIKKKLELLDIDKDIISSVIKSKQIPYYIDIVAKNSGYIWSKNINENSYIKKGQSILKIADLSTIWLNIEVYQKDINPKYAIEK